MLCYHQLPDTAKLSRSFPKVSFLSFGVKAMKVMAAALLAPASSPNTQINTDSTVRAS